MRIKCEVVIISNMPSDLETIAGLPVVQKTKSLGLYYTPKMDQSVNFEDRLQKGSGKNILHYSRLKRTGCDKEFSVARLMTQVDVIPTMLFGTCMWGYINLNNGGHMDHKMQRVCHVLPRHSLGLPVSTSKSDRLYAGWPDAHEGYHHHHICKILEQGIGSLCDENKLIKAALDQQALLFSDNQKCWMKSWSVALGNALHDVYLSECLLQVTEIDMQVLESKLLTIRLSALSDLGDPFSIQPCRHRKMAFTHNVLGTNRTWGQIPELLKLHTPPGCRKMWVRFLGAWSEAPTQDIGVISRTSYHNRLCRCCDGGAVANEAHIILECPATSHVRLKFAGRVRVTATLPVMMTCNTHNADLPAFIIECLQTYRIRNNHLLVGL